ncbi:phosphorylase family protein [Horticoccus sp. 23ND18S-11]
MPHAQAGRFPPFRLRLARLTTLLVVVSTLAVHAADVLLVATDDATLQPVLQQLQHSTMTTRAAWTSWSGQLESKSVVVARTEGDPLNAVAATTLALRSNPPRLVVVFGASRAHDPSLKAGDVVVSERFAAFDGIVSSVGALGTGSNALTWIKLPHPLITAGEKETPTPFFPADPAALAVARSLTPTQGRLVVGVLGSANQINREADRIGWIRTHWQTSTEDGESAHVAGTALLLGVPVIGLRVVDGTPAQAAELALRFMKAWK